MGSVTRKTERCGFLGRRTESELSYEVADSL